MKISTAFREAFRAYAGSFSATVKFLLVEACMTLAAASPLLFLTSDNLKWFALLAVPFWLLLMLWARVNAAGAMADALQGGSLFSFRLADPTAYGQKLLYGLKRCFFLLLWAAPLIAGLVIARVHMSGKMDGFTLLRAIKSFGGGDLMTGVLYLALILLGTLLILTIGVAFHSGDRHAFVRENMKLLKGHRGKTMLCWLCALITILPLIIALVIVVIRYLPVLSNLTGLITKSYKLPPVRPALLILGIGGVLTVPLLPLRSLITAAFVDGLEKANRESAGEEASSADTAKETEK